MGSLGFDVGLGGEAHMTEAVAALEAPDIVAFVHIVGAAYIFDDFQAGTDRHGHWRRASTA